MENKNLIIGSHVSMGSPLYYVGSVKEALSYNASTLMLYTGAPQNSTRTPIDKLKIEEAFKIASENGLDINNFVCHAPYLINLANIDDEKWELSCNFLKSEMQRTAAMGIKVIVLHPGNHMNNGIDTGIDRLIKALIKILEEDKTGVKIALETMAGKGTEICSKLEHFKYIFNELKGYPFYNQLGVCLDTCHMNDSGYDMSNYSRLIEEINNNIGLDKVFVVHINDSKNPRGAHKDRHENIGYGYLGFDTLNRIVNGEEFQNVPKILETPYFEGKPPYKKEIEMFREQKFDPNWRDNI